MDNRPIGVFDSGLGGLSVFSRLIRLMPQESFIYFGDTVNLPYGSKSKEELIEISIRIFDFFKSKKVKAVVMACNTTSALVYDYVKTKYNFEIYPVIQSVSKYIAEKNYSRIGVFATEAAVKSHAYKTGIQKYNAETEVFETACPLWVSIVENSLLNEKNSIENIKTILSSMLKNRVEKIVLGCTHYPYLMGVLSKYAPENMFIDPAVYFSQSVKTDLEQKNLLNAGAGSEPLFYTSAASENFEAASSLFYKVNHAEEICLSADCIKK